VGEFWCRARLRARGAGRGLEAMSSSSAFYESAHVRDDGNRVTLGDQREAPSSTGAAGDCSRLVRDASDRKRAEAGTLAPEKTTAAGAEKMEGIGRPGRRWAQRF